MRGQAALRCRGRQPRRRGRPAKSSRAVPRLLLFRMLILPSRQVIKGESLMRQDARERVVILCLAVILCALWVGTPRALHAEEGWRALGPFGEAGNEGLGGRVISLAVDPRNPNHVFAGSASGGLWVSELSGGRPDKGSSDTNPRAANWRDDSKPLWRWRY